MIKIIRVRNTGIQKSNGEFILFVDSDDTIVENSIEILYKYATETDVEIVIGNVLYCYQDGRQSAVFQRTPALNNMFKISGDICFVKLMEVSAYPPLVYLFFVKREFIMMNKIYYKKLPGKDMTNIEERQTDSRLR
jgi:glycosyltransferase involved in cell wall biosynthesis